MSLFGNVDQLKSMHPSMDYGTLMIGKVKDTNDPMQMGRVRVYVPKLDNASASVDSLPWAQCVSPLAGYQELQSRGPSDDAKSTGPVAYGMFGVPKVGTDVLVACLDGNPQNRVFLGSMFGTNLTSTLPHGRYTFNKEKGMIDGPLTATEQPLQPLYNNLNAAFGGSEGRKQPEFFTRAADYQAAGLGSIQQKNPNQVVSQMSDDREHEHTWPDGSKIKLTQGYAKSRIEPDLKADTNYVDTGVNYDPQTYSWSTPGFNAISMDDRPENARIRFRTASGHQIILDDSNERIYISPAQGNSWVEIDQSGNVDIFSGRRFSVSTTSDINFTTQGTFRVFAKAGIHMNSEAEIRVTTKSDYHLRANSTIRMHSVGNTYIQSDAAIHEKSGGVLDLTSGAGMNLYAGGDILNTAPNIHLNGPPAEQADPAGESQAFFTNRVPGHEPWPRTMMDKAATDQPKDNEHKPQFEANSPDVGKKELDETIPRNSNWKR